MKLRFHQLTRPLVETMYISRGGFCSRSHSLLVLEIFDKELVAEIIGDSRIVRFLTALLLDHIQDANPVSLGEFYDRCLDWERSFVYLERHCTVSSILCACNMLYSMAKCIETNSSLFSVLGLPEPRRNYSRVYASNIYWKEDIHDFENQLSAFNFSNTRIIKAHIGRLDPDKEIAYIRTLAQNKNIDGFMIDYNCAYSLNSFSALNQSLMDLDAKLIWIEEPGLPETASEWRRYIHYNMAAGENHHSLEELVQLADSGVKWIMPDLGRTLRIMDFPDLLRTCLAKDTCISFHSYSSGYLAYVSLLLSLSIPIDKTYYEHDFSDNAFIKPVIEDFIQIGNGEALISNVFDTPFPFFIEPDKTWNVSTL